MNFGRHREGEVAVARALVLHPDGAFEPSGTVRHVELEQNTPANEVVGHCRGHEDDGEPGQGGVCSVVGEVLGDLDVAVKGQTPPARHRGWHQGRKHRRLHH